MSTFKVGTKVLYRTPRGGRSGTGKIKSIQPTSRGLWYEVEDSGTREITKLREANISKA